MQSSVWQARGESAGGMTKTLWLVINHRNTVPQKKVDLSLSFILGVTFYYYTYEQNYANNLHGLKHSAVYREVKIFSLFTNDLGRWKLGLVSLKQCFAWALVIFWLFDHNLKDSQSQPSGREISHMLQTAGSIHWPSLLLHLHSVSHT